MADFTGPTEQATAFEGPSGATGGLDSPGVYPNDTLGPPEALRARTEGWIAGVRWAAAEADAQSSWREPIYILDLTDHLRLCATNPERGSAVSRDAAPEGYVGDGDVPEPEWMGLLDSAVEDMVRQAEARGRTELEQILRRAVGEYADWGPMAEPDEWLWAAREALGLDGSSGKPAEGGGHV